MTAMHGPERKSDHETVDVDAAFQRLLKRIGKPEKARGRIVQAIRSGETELWGRKAGGAWSTTDLDKYNLLIEAQQTPTGWHARVQMRGGAIGISDFEQYEWALASDAVDALLAPTTRGAGSKRKYDREWIMLEAAAYLYEHGLPESQAKLWKQLETILGDKSPGETLLKDIAGRCWRRMKKVGG
jgi:hypothetical protein